MSKVINLDVIRRKKNPSFVAVKPSERKFAFDWLPPMNSSLVNAAPLRPRSHTARLIAKAGGKLPDNFDWTNATDVAVKRMGGTPADAGRVAQILKPLNQLACGSCWAFSSSSVLADRYTLFQGLSTPLLLSPTYLLACDFSEVNSGENSDGCKGGLPSEAGTFFEKNGIPTWSCQDYGWCDPTSNNITNDMIPACSEIKNSCYKDSTDGGSVTPVSSPVAKMYKAKAGSTQALADPESLCAELFHHGPVVVIMRVFEDFISRDRSQTNNPGWTNTSNIYVNLGEKQALYPPYSSTSFDGGHAIVAVGYGIEPNPQGLPDDITAELKKRGGLRYIRARNSWAGQWNGDGFFKIAQSYPDLGINMTVGIDRIITVDAGGGQMINTGGGVAFLPDLPISEPVVFTDGKGPTTPPSPKPNGGGGGGGGGKKGAPSPNGGGGGSNTGGGGSNTGGGGSSGSNSGSSDNFWTQPGGISVIVVCSLAAVGIIVGAVLGVKHANKKKKMLKGGSWF